MTVSGTGGWHGRILNVDLSCNYITSEILDPELLQAYLGGRGLGVRLMRTEYQREPFAAGMPLIFAVGPLCGTPAPTASRLSIVSRSPLTGTIHDSSCGGLFPWQLKAAGYDVIKITGKSPEPVVLTIENGVAQLAPARHLWGLGVNATVAALAGTGSAAVIGPAGENGVLYANIMTSEGNAAGRGGLGAVMGAKNLKGVRIDGKCRTSIADTDRFNRGVEDVMRLLKASPVIFGALGFSEFGTSALVDLLSQRRMVPTRNFAETFFPETENYAAAALHRRFAPRKQGCYGCPIECKKVSVQGGRLPEHGSLSHFGALLGNSDLEGIVRAGQLCNDLGMDTLSAAASIATYSEALEIFPDSERLSDLLGMVAMRDGEGDLLAQGAQRLASELDCPQLAMTVKGLEIPAYDPRGAYGMALAYCTSNRGACHLRAYPVAHEILRKPVATNRFDFAGKAWMNIVAENTNAVVDSLAACRFAFLGAGLEEYAEILNAVTGLDYTPVQLGTIGERIFMMERYYNQVNGFSANDEILPERFFHEEGSSGEGVKVSAIDKERFVEERQRYYRLRGLNEQGFLEHKDFLESQP